MEDGLVSKPTVTRIFLGSVAAVIAGAILAFAAVWIAFVNGAFVMSGPDVIGVKPTPFAWAIAGIGIVAGLAMIAGFIGGLVSWIGALLSSAQLEDKTWFIVLLVLGLLSFGLVAMIAYVIAAPDGVKHTAERPLHAPA
jgi:hypothetical protein